jgi:anti-sigma regulatory factor (Ser/Thr protein kinase)/ActR/RegA family two-component response regulator
LGAHLISSGNSAVQADFMSSVPSLAGSAPAKRNALVIDVDPEIHTLLQRVLDPAIWSVRHAPSNSAALTLAKASPFDLIITSDKTSGREDVDLLRKIRRVRPHTRLIILTDESAPSYVIDSMKERAFSYFSEPFSMNSLSDMIQNAIDGPCWDDGIEILSATPEWIRLVARCDLGTAERLVQFLREIGDLPEVESNAVGTAFREILLNAMEYGGKFQPDQYVEISYVRAKHMVMCRVKDPGEGFSLDEIEHAAVANPDEDPMRHVVSREAKGLRPGGYGVLLAQKFVDELIYSEKGNEVLLVKYIDRPGSAAAPATAN